jgi:Rieske Fe-S protein
MNERYRMGQSRRWFLGGIGKALGIAFFLPRMVYARAKKVAVSLDKVPKLTKVGASTVLKIKNKWVLLVRTKPTEIKAVSATCTHKQCDVNYNPSSKRIECGCHGSKFDLDGKVLNGPAKSDLYNYKAELRGNKIILIWR